MSYVKSEFNRALVNRFHLELLDGGHLDVADEILASDFMAHMPGAPAEWMEGIDGAKWAVSVLRTAFTGFRVRDREQTVMKGGKVAVWWVITARHTGDLPDIPATGKEITITGINTFRVEPPGSGGKIAELWVSWDQLGLMQQLGAVREVAARAV